MCLKEAPCPEKLSLTFLDGSLQDSVKTIFNGTYARQSSGDYKNDYYDSYLRKHENWKFMTSDSVYFTSTRDSNSCPTKTGWASEFYRGEKYHFSIKPMT